MNTAHDPPATRLQVHLRWMLRCDHEDVVAIGRHHANRPLTAAELIRMLRRRNNIGYVAEHAGRVVGYMVYSLDRADECLRLLELAVEPRLAAAGVGSALMARLVAKLTPMRFPCVELYVRETNVAAQLFLRSRGFAALWTEPAAFEDTGEDAYMFRYDRPDSGPD